MRSPRETPTTPMHERVVEMTIDGADQHIDKLAKKHTSVDSRPWRRFDEQRVMVKIAVD